MARYNVHAGHGPVGGAIGAVGYLNESVEARKVKNQVIQTLRNAGHTVFDCTDDTRSSVNQNLANIVAKCNANRVDLDVSIHLNAGGGSGVEVWCYNSGTAAVASRICQRISSTFGIPNRGVKYSTGFYVLRNTVAPAILVECCFVDSQRDASVWDPIRCGNAIASGIAGRTLPNTSGGSNNPGNPNNPSVPSNPSVASNPSNLNNSNTASMPSTATQNNSNEAWKGDPRYYLHNNAVGVWQNAMNIGFDTNELDVDNMFGVASQRFAANHLLWAGQTHDYPTAVRWLQNRLRHYGFYKLQVTGRWSSYLDVCIQVFQGNRGIAADKIVGLITTYWLLEGTIK